MNKKTPSESYTEQVQIVSSADLNGFSRLFGGKLMEWADIVAAVCARRHSGKNVITAMVDKLEFHAAAHANDTILLTAKVTYAGKTSMEICVESYVEKNTGERLLINRAFFIMVAMDKNEHPCPVPEVLPKTPEEKILWQAGFRRYIKRKQS